MHDVAPHGTDVIVPASRWRDLELRSAPMRFILTFFVDALDSLFAPPEEERLRHPSFVELLEAIVGPYESSRGPGPFLPMPAAARPLVFDEPPDAHFLADASSLRAAIDEVRAARAPVKPWDDDEELYEWSPTAPPWNVPWSTLALRWEPFRDRFVALLNEALETDRAVLFVSAEVGDLGPGGTVPVDESWGCLVR
jgi:hypothetical protein